MLTILIIWLAVKVKKEENQFKARSVPVKHQTVLATLCCIALNADDRLIEDDEGQAFTF